MILTKKRQILVRGRESRRQTISDLREGEQGA